MCRQLLIFAARSSLINSALLTECKPYQHIPKFISSNADTLISVREVPTDYNPNWVFFEDENKMLSISRLSATQHNYLQF